MAFPYNQQRGRQISNSSRSLLFQKCWAERAPEGTHVLQTIKKPPFWLKLIGFVVGWTAVTATGFAQGIGIGLAAGAPGQFELIAVGYLITAFLFGWIGERLIAGPRKKKVHIVTEKYKLNF
jgi:hypothetical protein